MSEAAVPPSFDWERYTRELLDAALIYAARGWYVLLLHGVRDDLTCTCAKPKCIQDGRVGKHPRWSFDTATTDPAIIRGWLRDYPDSNVGVVLRRSGLLVVDGDHWQVVEVLAEEVESGTFWQPTRRGRHWLYAHHSGGEKQTWVGDVPLDVLCGNNIVVMNPSRRLDGRVYPVINALAPVRTAPRWADEIACRNGCQEAEGNEAQRCRPRHPWYQSMLNDERDLVLDDEIRHADRSTYRQRHKSIWAILLHDVQRGASDDAILGDFARSTLWTKAQEDGDPDNWMREQIRRARKQVEQRPAKWVLSGDSLDAANQDDAGLSVTERKLLRAFQTRAALAGEGRFSASLAELAIDAKVGVATAHTRTLDLIKKGFITRRFKAGRGSRMASVYALALPPHLRRDEEEGGDEPNTTNPIGVCGGGVRPMTPLPTDVVLDHDAFWLGKTLLGGSVRVLQVLSVEVPQSRKALARRLSVEPSTVRHHVNRMMEHDLLVEVRDGLLLRDDWRDRLDAIAAAGDVLGKTDRRRRQLADWRQGRRDARRDHALAHGLPLRRQPEVEHMPAVRSLLAVDAQHAAYDHLTLAVEEQIRLRLRRDLLAEDYATGALVEEQPDDLYEVEHDRLHEHPGRLADQTRATR